MRKLILNSGHGGRVTQGQPNDFATTAPFPARKKSHDPLRVAAIAAAAIAFLAFIGSMVAVLMMRTPV